MPRLGTPSPAACRRKSWIDIPQSGIYEAGAAQGGFSFDNEGPRHRVYLQGLRLATRPVTCGEYLRFIEGGGYARPEFWLSDGWAAVAQENWQAPALLDPRRGSAGRPSRWVANAPLVPAEPVAHVNYYEASAYAAWAGRRLPTEFEWEVGVGRLTAPPLKPNRIHPDPIQGPVSAGDAREWTGSAYSPYPGYRRPGGAIGEYNGKFMSGQMVLRGSSWATPEGHARLSYRNFFPPAARWQASGFRLAEDL